MIDYEAAKWWAAAFLAGFFGRLMAHTREVQEGRRSFFGKHLLWELPIAIGMAYIAAGLAELSGIEGNAIFSIVAAASYLGPASVEALLYRFLDRRK